MEQEFLKLIEKTFDKDTVKNIKLEDKPLLNAIFDYFIDDLYLPNKKYEDLKEQKQKVEKELEESFKGNQEDLFIKHWELNNAMTSEMERQMFLYGCILGNKLNKELNI